MYNTKKSPYPHGNYATTEDFLEEIVLILANERGLEPIGKDGYEDVKIDGKDAVSLNVPKNAVSASIFVEADEATKNKDIIIRFKENGDKPTNKSGQTLEHKDILKPVGKKNLDNLKFIGIEKKETHTLRVQYYQTAQVLPTPNN